jgi:hypothetical protein
MQVIYIDDCLALMWSLWRPQDNTLTEPYSLGVAPQLAPSLQRCREAFQGRLVLMSNSAGLAQFDPRGGHC